MQVFVSRINRKACPCIYYISCSLLQVFCMGCPTTSLTNCRELLLITFKAIQGLAPKYLCDLLTFKSSLYNLRSSDSILLSMPAARSKTLVDRALMVAAPRLWNSLPKELRAITNVNSFKAHSKTYLFKTLYW